MMSLEKRLNFTLDEMDVTAHAYDYFKSLLTFDDPQVDWSDIAPLLGANNDLNNTTSTETAPPNTNSTETSPSTDNSTTINAADTKETNQTARFHAVPIPIDFPQYFKYERVKELEIWAIKLSIPSNY